MLPLNDVNNWEEAARDKGLAQVGDALVNFIYSIARSSILNSRTGKKVNRTILSESLKQANLRYLAKPRADSHDMADTVEAIVAFAWAKNLLSIDSMIHILTGHLKLTPHADIRPVEENLRGAEAFKCLLEEIKVKAGI